MSGPARVLVTGATGFIGGAVARQLLAAGRSVTALVRGRPGQPAASRLAAAIGAVPDGRGLDVVAGDLAEPGCGLADADRRRLAESVECVVHCAGDTSFFPEEITAFRHTHVNGPVALLAMLAGGRLRTWAHVSTAFVCGRRSGVILESEGDVGQEFHNPYERVKLEAERQCREAGARLGVDVRVFRPSAVVGAGPETPGAAPASLLFRFIRLAAALVESAAHERRPLRIEASPAAPFNVVPLRFVADALVALSALPEAAHQTAHLVVSEPPTQASVLRMIEARLGGPGLALIDPAVDRLVAPTLRERQVRTLLARYRDYLARDVRFDDTNARRLLARCDRDPATLHARAVARLVDHALAPEATGGRRRVTTRVCPRG